MTANKDFIYVVYIASTPEKVWDAFFDGELTRLFWGVHRNVSDWKVGSTWTHQDCDDGSVRITGRVLEFDPPRRLVVTWHPPGAEGDPARVSRVTYEVTPFFDAVRLTLKHEELDPDSPTYQGVINGWPGILSSLKSLLETGKPLSMSTRRWGGAGRGGESQAG
jgi:uncharacterized protein YndB with AHSA1/START domain